MAPSSPVRLVIEMDVETGKVRVGHTNNRMHNDYMLAEARRILDRKADQAASGKGGDLTALIEIPDGVLPDGVLLSQLTHRGS